MLTFKQALYLQCGLDKLPPWEHQRGPLGMCGCTEEELTARKEYSRILTEELKEEKRA